MKDLHRIWRRIFRLGESLLGPTASYCGYCGVPIRRYASSVLPLCRRCFDGIPWIEEVKCAHCGRPESCPDCVRRGPSALQLSRSAVKYDERMKEWLAAYKYRRNERLQSVMAPMLHLTLKRYEADYGGKGAIDALTYVPVSSERLEERGFNQAKQLAERVGELAGIPALPLLRRDRDTARQSRKSRAERLRDLADAFSVDPEGANRLLKNASSKPINIVIIDDVYTTGSTLHHCAAVIAARLDARVYGLTWAR